MGIYIFYRYLSFYTSSQSMTSNISHFTNVRLGFSWQIHAFEKDSQKDLLNQIANCYIYRSYVILRLFVQTFSKIHCTPAYISHECGGVNVDSNTVSTVFFGFHSTSIEQVLSDPCSLALSAWGEFMNTVFGFSGSLCISAHF